MYKTKAIAKHEKRGQFSIIEVGRGHTSEEDIDIEVKFCGFCHTDCHLVDNDFGFTEYPAIGGHEVAGVVTAIGSEVGWSITRTFLLPKDMRVMREMNKI